MTDKERALVRDLLDEGHKAISNFAEALALIRKDVEKLLDEVTAAADTGDGGLTNELRRLGAMLRALDVLKNLMTASNPHDRVMYGERLQYELRQV